jgi:hypothetical protein
MPECADEAVGPALREPQLALEVAMVVTGLSMKGEHDGLGETFPFLGMWFSSQVGQHYHRRRQRTSTAGSLPQPGPGVITPVHGRMDEKTVPGRGLCCKLAHRLKTSVTGR